MLTLKIGWAGVTQAGMQTLAIVPDLQVVKDGEPCISPRGEWCGGTLGFESAPETLLYG